MTHRHGATFKPWSSGLGCLTITVDTVFVRHVGLEEVFVAELFIAQFAVGLDIEDLDLAATAGCGSEALLQVTSGL